MVFKQKESANWWYKFTWNGKLIRESTKQTNKRLAETMEATHKSALAKGEVGIRAKEPVPTLKTFGEDSFLPFVRSTRAAKPNTVRFYTNSVTNLSAYSKLADLPLDQINSEIVAGFVARRQLDQVQISTINRDLATLRRMFHLAIEWGRVKTLLPRIKLLRGENHRERVLSLEEEAAYLAAARQIGGDIEKAYQQALTGICAVQRGQEPRRPNSHRLSDVTTILFECALRPEECFRLKRQNFRDGLVVIYTPHDSCKSARPRSPRNA
jgi:integrase